MKLSAADTAKGKNKMQTVNPNIYGDSGSSYGICQWHNERFTALKNYTEEWDTLQGQLEYLHYELKNGIHLSD